MPAWNPTLDLGGVTTICGLLLKQSKKKVKEVKATPGSEKRAGMERGRGQRASAQLCRHGDVAMSPIAMDN